MWKSKIVILVISFGCFLALAQAQCTTRKVDYKMTLDDDNGNTIKKICLINKGLSAKEADDYCKKQKMKLLNVNSDAIQTALDNLIMDNWEGTPLAIRVDGVRLSGKWKVSDGKVDLWNKLKWRQNNDPPNGDDSLTINTINWPFMKLLPVNAFYDGLPADLKLMAICEY
jgi:hypothetical protein